MLTIITFNYDGILEVFLDENTLRRSKLFRNPTNNDEINFVSLKLEKTSLQERFL